MNNYRLKLHHWWIESDIREVLNEVPVIGLVVVVVDWIVGVGK